MVSVQITDESGLLQIKAPGPMNKRYRIIFADRFDERIVTL